MRCEGQGRRWRQGKERVRARARARFRVRARARVGLGVGVGVRVRSRPHRVGEVAAGLEHAERLDDRATGEIRLKLGYIGLQPLAHRAAAFSTWVCSIGLQPPTHRVAASSTWA